jgi:DNA-binding LacI/PurR family transcriptional regulator
MRDEWFFQNNAYEQGGAEMARRFLEMKDRPTGLCIVNDYVALAFMVEIIRAGLRVPEDVSIVSHDNRPVATYCPVPVTSLTHPADEIAGAVVELLLDRILDRVPAGTPPRQVVLTSELIERESVAARG